MQIKIDSNIDILLEQHQLQHQLQHCIEAHMDDTKFASTSLQLIDIVEDDNDDTVLDQIRMYVYYALLFFCIVVSGYCCSWYRQAYYEQLGSIKKWYENSTKQLLTINILRRQVGEYMMQHDNAKQMLINYQEQVNFVV